MPSRKKFTLANSRIQTPYFVILQVQVSSKPLGPEDVHYFLASMDKICSHGLKNEKLGYWPFVQEFTHKSGVSYIADMKNCMTGPGRGRSLRMSGFIFGLRKNRLKVQGIF